MSSDTESRPGEPMTYGEGAEGFPHGSKYPLFVGAGMFFTALGLLWWPLLIVGGIVLLYGMAGWVFEYTVTEYETGVVPQQKRERLGMTTNYLAMVLVIISELLVFAAVFIAYLYLEAARGPFPPAGSAEPSFFFGALLLGVLFIGSMAMYGARTSIQGGNRSGLKQGVIVGLLTNIAFVAILLFEWVRLWDAGLHWSVAEVGAEVGVYGSVVFLATGLHLAHVIAGIALALILIYRINFRGHFSENRYTMVATTEAYQHMLTMVQLLIVVVIYL